MKTLSVRWFNSSDTHIGIVLCETKLGKQKAYINGVLGRNIERDIEKIKNWGCKIDYNHAKGIFGDMVKKEKYVFK